MRYVSCLKVIPVLFIGTYVAVGIAGVALLWTIWPPLAWAFVAFLWFKAFR
jgi:hypothetical protein